MISKIEYRFTRSYLRNNWIEILHLTPEAFKKVTDGITVYNTGPRYWTIINDELVFWPENITPNGEALEFRTEEGDGNQGVQ